MKKLNRKGFTLIELLAVITILGILMLVAIPAVSRTIENSRRDTFGDLAKEYISTVRNAVIADELTCEGDESPSATTEGLYYFLISTGGLGSDDYIKNQTTDLMEKGGKSSWGNNNVTGMVVWKKSVNSGVTSGFKTKYYVFLVDKGNHGISSLYSEDHVIRSNVSASTSVKFTEISTADNLKEKVRDNNGEGTEIGALTFSGTNKNIKECKLNR